MITTPIDLLSIEELNMLKDYIEAYAGPDGGYCDMKADIKYVLRCWNEAKQYLLDSVFGDKLILSKDIEYTESENNIADNMRSFLLDYRSSNYDDEAGSFVERLKKKFDTFIGEYVDKNKDNLKGYKYDYIYFLDSLLTGCTLAKNKVGKSFADTADYIFYFNDGKKLVVRPGDKAIKVIGKLAEKLGVEGFEHFRLVHSRILNQKKLKGKLCLSIHPMDYMTMSDNDSDWKSCMSWINNGEYRQGTVEMMNSPKVIVAYLASEKDMVVDTRENSYTWNNKKWRQLFIFDEDYIANVKGYPYQNDALTHEVLNWIAELAEKNGQGPYDEIRENSPYGTIVIDEDLKYTVLFDPNTNLMYNDFNSCNNFHFIRLAKRILTEQDYELDGYYSGLSECMICGGLGDLDREENRLVCCDCYKPIYCYECGDPICEEDVIWVDDEPLCEYCYNAATAIDCLTGEVHLKDRMTPIYLGTPDGTGYYRHPLLYLEKESGIEILEKKFGKYCDVVQGRWENIHYFTNIDLTKFFKLMKDSNTAKNETVAEFISDLENCYPIRPFDSIRR